MRTIRKYVIPLSATFEDPEVLPLDDYDSVILHVGEQDESLMVWAEMDPTKPVKRPIKVAITGTGHEDIPSTSFNSDIFYLHVGSVQMSIGLVWHVYLIEDLSPRED